MCYENFNYFYLDLNLAPKFSIWARINLYLPSGFFFLKFLFKQFILLFEELT